MTQQRRDRRWQVDQRVYDEEGTILGIDRQAGIQAFLEAEALLAREGGAISVIPVRAEQPPAPDALVQESEMVNLGYIFEHQFAPTVGQAPPAVRQSAGDGWHTRGVPEYPQHNGAPGQAGAVFPQAPDPVAQQPAEDVAEEPQAVMPQETDPADQHTEPRASDLPEPAPLDPAALVPRTQ